MSFEDHSPTFYRERMVGRGEERIIGPMREPLQ